jgi:hypothetical protein
MAFVVLLQFSMSPLEVSHVKRPQMKDHTSNEVFSVEILYDIVV